MIPTFITNLNLIIKWSTRQHGDHKLTCKEKLLIHMKIIYLNWQIQY